MRLIDADELKRDFCTGCIENCPNECDEIRIINSQPTIEAEPVRLGKWELIDEAEPRRYGCSRCKRLAWWETDYCPNCGAKMEGEE